MNKEELTQNLINEGYLTSPDLVEAFNSIDRADFVLPDTKTSAYENIPLPIGFGQTISQPLTVAFMLELLDPQPGEKILDVGAGSGWQSALLAHVVGPQGKVTAVEHIPELCEFAKQNIEKYGFLKQGTIQFFCGDVTEPLPQGSYDKIVSAASAPVPEKIGPASLNRAINAIPETWKQNLAVGGKIVAPIGNSVWLFTKHSDAEWDEKESQGFVFVPLVAGQKKELREQTKIADKKYAQPISKKITDRPQPQKKESAASKIQKKYFYAVVGCFIVLLLLFVYEIYIPHTNFQNQKEFVVQKGAGSRMIAAALKEQGFINSKWIFVGYVTVLGQSSELKPGTYSFAENATIAGIAGDLIAGGSAERTVTIPEGWNVRDISRYFEGQNMFQADAFQKFVGIPGMNYTHNKKYPKPKDYSWQFTFLSDKPESVGLEGYLFPDTYRVYRDATMDDIALTMLKNFDKQLAHEMRQDIINQGKTLFQAITMASLIEKEVSDGHDRKVVSGILWKRLQAGIPLQVDATIVYITGKKGPITADDKAIDSPYNTYKYRGLPLGPIANPGLSAILAAIYPEKSPYLYYLSTKKGITIFSKTLEEHNAAKTKYLR